MQSLNSGGNFQASANNNNYAASFVGDILSQLGANESLSCYNQSIEVHQNRRNNLSMEIEALRKAAGINLESLTGSNQSNNNQNNNNQNGDNASDKDQNNFSSGISADFSLASQQMKNMQTQMQFNASIPGFNPNLNLGSGWQRVRIAQQCVHNLEIELENSRGEYRNLMSELGERLKAEARKLGSCVERARPLFEAQRNMRRMQSEVQSASISYKKAQNLKEVAKTMVKAAEQKVKECEKIPTNAKNTNNNNEKSGDDNEDQNPSDSQNRVGNLMNWLEQLNQSNDNFQVASKTSQALANRHSKAAQEFQILKQKVQSLESTSAIKYLDQARPYFNLQLDLWSKAEQHGSVMVRLEASLAESRAQLSGCLKEMNENRESDNNNDTPNSRSTSGDSNGMIHGMNNMKLHNNQLHQLDEEANSGMESISDETRNQAPSVVDTMRMLGHPNSVIPNNHRIVDNLNQQMQNQHNLSPHSIRNMDLPGSRRTHSNSGNNNINGYYDTYDDAASDDIEDLFKSTPLFGDDLSRNTSQLTHPTISQILEGKSSGNSPRSERYFSQLESQNSPYSHRSHNSNSNKSNSSNNILHNNSNPSSPNSSYNKQNIAENDDALVKKIANTDMSDPTSILQNIGFYKNSNSNDDNINTLASKSSPLNSRPKHARNPYSLVMIDSNQNNISGNDNGEYIPSSNASSNREINQDDLIEFDEDSYL